MIGPVHPAACIKCGGLMRPGIATQETVTSGAPDFGDHRPGDRITMSVGGPGVVINVSKCRDCGWSVK